MENNVGSTQAIEVPADHIYAQPQAVRMLALETEARSGVVFVHVKDDPRQYMLNLHNSALNRARLAEVLTQNQPQHVRDADAREGARLRLRGKIEAE